MTVQQPQPQFWPHPVPLTVVEEESHCALIPNIDRYLFALRGLDPKVVIYKNRFTEAWVMVVYKRPEYEASLLSGCGCAN